MNLHQSFRPRSWGRYPSTEAMAVRILDRDLRTLPDGGGTLLPFGNGRSYGDVALNDRGTLLLTRGLDRFIAFDHVTGVLACEAGVLLDEILALVVPLGWFLPVTPGTRFVTVGGAIANDIHGKSHHRHGSFGNHVRKLTLLRSDRGPLECSRESEAELFRATIGGLGLTGLILRAELALVRIAGPYLSTETRRFVGLDEFVALSRESSKDWEYTVAWVDCLATGRRSGRGVFFRARHSEEAPARALPKRRSYRVPFAPPFSLINQVTLRAFNEVYFRAAPSQTKRALVHYLPFFYPLDELQDWNVLYGPRGFLQHQCVIPYERIDALREVFRAIAREGQGSFLAVLKVLGGVPPSGLMSFSRPGITLALDFPIQGPKTFSFLDRLDDIVVEAGGAVNPSKDARMSPRTFAAGFPNAGALEQLRDPRFSSTFWRRVWQES